MLIADIYRFNKHNYVYSLKFQRRIFCNFMIKNMYRLNHSNFLNDVDVMNNSEYLFTAIFNRHLPEFNKNMSNLLYVYKICKNIIFIIIINI